MKLEVVVVVGGSAPPPPHAPPSWGALPQVIIAHTLTRRDHRDAAEGDEDSVPLIRAVVVCFFPGTAILTSTEHFLHQDVVRAISSDLVSCGNVLEPPHIVPRKVMLKEKKTKLK
jgi:hypothetical protein